MKKAELLSPAGNMESLIAAIEGGCDAVYLSGVLYGARSYANNFNNEQLEEAVKYAHLYGVRIYVTINIIIYEAEVKNFLKYVEFLQSINVDAVIVQDIGMMDLLRQKYPDLEIHASTQMHIHNLEGIKLLEKLGIKRAVLARETSIDLVKEIKKKTTMELEIFVHGALCICYSGQCLMSSLIGGRSGNRGTCAQPCRQSYDLIVDNKVLNNNKYLLSTKDLNILNNINELLKSGINSLKIEGRMKRPEYVYFVTSLYRKAIDAYYDNKEFNISEQELEELSKLFNRKFTKGFLFHENNDKVVNQYRPNHQGIIVGKVTKTYNGGFSIKLSNTLNVQDGIRILIEKEDIGLTVEKMFKNEEKIICGYKNEVIDIPFIGKVEEGADVLLTTDNTQLKNITEEINTNKRKVLIDMKVYFYKQKNIKISVNDGINNVELISEYIVEESKNFPITKSKIEEQLSKTGNTVYKISNLDIEMDDNIFISIKIINEIRRNVLEKLNNQRLYKTNNTIGEYFKELNDYPIVKEKSIFIDSLEKYNEIKKEDFKKIYMNDNLFSIIEDDRKILKMARVLENHNERKENLLIGELGSTIYKNIISDFSFNVVNSYSVAFLHALGVERVTLSHELNVKQAKNIIDNYRARYNKNPNLEFIVSGKIEAMITKYNLLEHYNIVGKEAILIDKYKNKFSIEINNGLMYIFHYDYLNIKNGESYYEIGINSLRY
jgi:Collagenase and related proteases